MNLKNPDFVEKCENVRTISHFREKIERPAENIFARIFLNDAKPVQQSMYFKQNAQQNR